MKTDTQTITINSLQAAHDGQSQTVQTWLIHPVTLLASKTLSHLLNHCTFQSSNQIDLDTLTNRRHGIWTLRNFCIGRHVDSTHQGFGDYAYWSNSVSHHSCTGQQVTTSQDWWSKGMNESAVTLVQWTGWLVLCFRHVCNFVNVCRQQKIHDLKSEACRRH